MESKYLSFFINNQTPVYGGEEIIKISQRNSISKGDSANSKLVFLPNHTGTHIDFPKHFGDEGKTINDYTADFWFFNHPFLIDYEANKEEIISLEDLLNEIPKTTDFLIVKTGFQKYRGTEVYWNNNPGIAPDLASRLKQHCPGLKVIGFDFISLSSYQNRIVGREAHKKFLLEEDILIIEDMDLQQANKTIKKLIVLPLMLDEADGCPVTVIAKYE